MDQSHSDSRIIDALGGATATAALCSVRPQAVSAWRKTGIPPARRMYLKVIRPAVFEKEHSEPLSSEHPAPVKQAA